MIREQDIVHIGKIQRTHGTSGELQCRMQNTWWEDNDATFIILKVEEINVPFRVTDWRTKGSEDVLLTLHGVDCEQQALRYVGCEAYMLRTDLPEDSEQPMHMDTLTGYTLYDSRCGAVGTITAIDTSTMNTLVQLDNGTILPLHEDFVAEIDTDKKTIVVHLPEGLIADNE